MKNFLSFKNRLKIFLLFMAVIPLVLIGYGSYSSITEERAYQREIDIENMYRHKAALLETYFESVQSDLLSIVRSASYFVDKNDIGLQDYLLYLESVEVGGQEPYFVIKKGTNIDFVHGKPSLQNLKHTSQSPHIELRYHMTGMNEDPFISITVNKFTVDGDYVIAGIDVDMETLDDLVNNSESGPYVDWQIWLGNESVSNRFTGIENTLTPLAFEKNRLFVDKTNAQKSYMVFDSVDRRMTTKLFSEIPDEDKLLSAVKMKYFIIVLILVVMSTALALAYARHMYYPVSVIDRKFSKLIEGNLSTRIGIWHSGIFKPIVDGFNELATQAEGDYNQLLEQSMEMLQKQDELLEINQSLTLNYEDLKKTNRRLEYSKEKFRRLIENIDDLVWLIDRDGNITYMNEAFNTLLGLKPENMIGKSFIKLLALDETDIKNQVIDAIYSKDVEALQLWFKRSQDDEPEIFMTNTVRVFKNGQFEGVQGISRPLMENWLLTQKLTRRSQALEDIRDITRTLTKENNIDALFDLIVKKIYELYDVIVCSIRILNENKVLELVNVTGDGSQFLIDDGIDDPKDLRFKVIDENKMIYLETPESYHIQNYDDISSLTENAESLVLLPISDGQDKTGVISILFNEKLPQNELMILSTIGVQSTLAIRKAQLYEKQREEFMATIKVLITAIEAKDAYTEGHSVRVSEFATIIATEIGMSSQEIEDIQFAGLLHDIGKIGIDDFILTKKGRLSPFESDKIKEHPEIGRKILQPIGFSKSIMDGVTLHHKRYDLTGYPHKEVVEDLPVSAAIIGVCDALDAMTSNRSYSRGRPLNEAIEEIIKHKATQFSPQVVDSIVRIYESDKSVLEQIITGKVQVMS